ncbi:MAG TPA: hypothetical protein VHE54_09225 [Puia sp.]|nr:hypothetical protein [Puia sp.]
MYLQKIVLPGQQGARQSIKDALIREIHRMKERTRAKMQELFARYDSELPG